MTKEKIIYNPLRPCKVCGDIGNAYGINKPNGKIIYTSKCKKCLNLDVKSKTFTICQKCSSEKEASYNRYCTECINETRWFIQPEELLIIKRWCRKQELRNWMTDLQGLNELITMYHLVTHREGEYDNMEPAEQFKNMWEKVLSVYKEIKNISDETLKNIKLDKIELKVKKKELTIRKLENSDLSKFFDIIEKFEYEGKIYSFEEEYLNCITGDSKVSCVRCRKIISSLKNELLRLKLNTGVKYKYGKK